MAKFLKVARDKQTGHFKLGRLVCVFGIFTLSFGFYKESLVNGLVYQDYIAYALGCTILYAPSKAKELIDAIRGNNNNVVTILDDSEAKIK